MRKELADISNRRTRFRAVFERYGKKAGWKGRTAETLLLKNITTTDGDFIAGHLWFNMTKEFEALALNPGDTIEFDARSRTYTKGYVNRLGAIDRRKTDYKLSHPSKVRKIEADAGAGKSRSGTR